jgi:hypothetical protein
VAIELASSAGGGDAGGPGVILLIALVAVNVLAFGTAAVRFVVRR